MPTMVRWSPFRELETLERRMRRMFDEFEPSGLAGTSMPAADIYEENDQFVVEVDVPGYAEGDLDVEVTDHTLCIKGERSEEKEEKDKAFQIKERLERRFERRFVLPEEADLEALEARYDKGVLQVRAPKALAAEPRRVEIEHK